MLKNNIYKRKECLVFLLFCMGTLILRLFYISKVNGPFVYADEFGYWAHAAHLAGNTWAGVMSNVGWYSFGYSFVLAPALLLANQMSVIYKIAVLFNVAMCVGIYGLAYLITRRLLGNLTAFQRGAIAFAATSFSSYIFYSYVTMCETMLALLLWVVFYELISLEERSAWWKGLSLGITLGVMYMVHNRMLAVIAASLVCMLLLVLRRQVSWKEFAVCLTALIFMIVLNSIFKNYLINMVENNQTINALGLSVKVGSAYSKESQLQKIMGLFHVYGMKEFILNLIGQLWECMSATYLLFGFGCVYAMIRLQQCYKTGKGICLYLFPVSAVLLSIGITAVYFYSSPLTETTGKTRIDTLFYGRYNECFFGMLILLGIAMLIERQKNYWKVYLILTLVYIGLAAIMYVRLGNTDDKYLNVVSAIGIHIFHWLGEFAVWKCALAALIGAVIVIGLYYVKLPHNLQYYIACLLLVFLFATTALHCMRLCIRGENDNTARYTEIFEYLRENTGKDEIVYICDENKMAYDVQTRLVDRIVVSILPENLDQAENGAYMIIKETDADRVSMEEYDVCLKWEEYLVLRK